MQRWYESTIDGSGGAAGALLRPPLWLASRAYAVIIAARNARYDRGGDGVQRVAAPVVSIGNLTTGGTGKTPMAIHVAERLRARDRRPAVVSRGYAAGNAQADELALIEGAVPQLPCIADPDRVAGARRAITEHDANVIVLDDGFQHRRIARDLDLVLIDATQPLHSAHLLPRGRLREPIASLVRADALVITRADQVERDALSALRETIRRTVPVTPILACTHRPLPTRPLSPHRVEDQDRESAPAFLASGIARPAAFERTARQVGIDVRGHLRFADHQRYTIADARNIRARAASAGARRVVVTEKDAVKLARLDFDWLMPVDVLGVRIDFCADGGTMLDDLLARMLSDWSARGNRQD